MAPAQDPLHPPREPGDRWRAVYACRTATSRGRLVEEPGSATRNPFQRDRDRIIHSTAFRRLKHKTQVFVSHEGDHFRTRLTHSIEVAQIARALARALGLDEDLAEALALAHDLGHTPFGHTGEDALDECMKDFGGFDHNAQTLRIVTRLERRYAGFDGLNLTWETLEGLVKHNGPLVEADGRPVPRYAATGIPAAIVEYQAKQDLWLATHASAEAQAAALADDIAYNAHDIDDGLRAGMFELAELRAVPFLAGLLDEIERLHPGLEKPRATNELVRRVITRFVEDVIGHSEALIAALAPADVDAIRRAGAPVVAFSQRIAAADKAIKGFLYPNMYRHPRIKVIRQQAADVVRDLFDRFNAAPEAMPGEWSADCATLDEARRARRIADYIAGMTDSYALGEHRRLFDATPSLR
ncbi:deoxyguanosinetriphosphate triphosphohydrolase [Bosea sp. (in: a-proteobacteria)]|uniref:deoxyguanosinetriphosphate triphosphohydrolase n=1 Tax=Bosea sp. (in: a-proteobacteria) TaxID=1871050 RepID=UPI001AC8D358|nr:deoxyguanosinetriphosphate triphosphohydrolase [Bosea sp. (in: a-proteobacteria)]MBN9438574.1 deoxyguanosinetriphosphate triphosphohydrolase [Bosea sp. (in: a-proteobacteria)]